MNKKLILSAVLTSILAAPSAFAGSVVNWTGSDGFSAEPYVKGTNMAQIRLDSGFTGSSPTNALIPGLSFTTAFADGFDMGIGGNLNFSGIGSSASSYASSALFPWIRAAVPLGIENVKTGIMVGTSIPLNSTGQLNQGGHNLNMNMMTNEYFPGVTALADIYLGQLIGGGSVPLTMGVNAGYARGITSGTNLVTGNLNFSLPTNNVILYEEQFVNYPVNNFANGGLRLGISIPVADKFLFDIKPAALWEASASGAAWSFNPSVGATVKF